MTIQLLSTRLANQIAAGEVVERPASVIKELVENSLDAGATKIQIDVEKGGSRLLRVRDNGCGVEKSQLILALSRHATSKIKNLDDLEAIVSLGFRGEALASIGSVSRLHFTSKTDQQHEAWQAFAQGRDMDVELNPVAHPQGTTVEVADLFFNTPARRRFLRTEKTEFNHIDELIKRFALSRFDVELVLKHNDKLVRNLKVASTQAQKERRVAAICGTRFMEHALAISYNDAFDAHNAIKLSGWLGLPEVCKAHSDVQYCYVNGRMMRDKLINHAIRQAYQEYLPEGVVPSYVLFIELDPSEVDVNVHPAKHEVRFHQARIVHDLITQVLGSALGQSLTPMSSVISEPSASVNHDYNRHANSGQNDSMGNAGYSRSSAAYSPQPQGNGNVGVAAQSYQDLLSPAQVPRSQAVAPAEHAAANVLLGQVLSIVGEKYVALLSQSKVKLLTLDRLHALVTEQELLHCWSQGLVSQPLLLPVSVTLDSSLLEQVALNTQLFRRLGIDIALHHPQIIIKQVPSLLRNKDIALLIPQLLQLLAQQQHLEGEGIKELVCRWLSQSSAKPYNLNEAIELIEKAQHYESTLEQYKSELLVEVDFNPSIALLQATNTNYIR